MYYLTPTKEKIPIYVNLRGAISFEANISFLILNEHVTNAEAAAVFKNSLLRDKSDPYVEPTPLCGIQSFQQVTLQFLKELAACLYRMRRLFLTFVNSTRGSDKSLAQPGRKQAKTNKLRVYSTHSPRSSI